MEQETENIIKHLSKPDEDTGCNEHLVETLLLACLLDQSVFRVSCSREGFSAAKAAVLAWFGKFDDVDATDAVCSVAPDKEGAMPTCEATVL